MSIFLVFFLCATPQLIVTIVKQSRFTYTSISNKNIASIHVYTEASTIVQFHECVA